ncbi:hypothetical protein [Leptospira paudalimensis]|uniref:Uncharacterized protein n=1 Tax=Leptospira paudalimensis TaxID=2950024 RepID=A0ABT3M3B8_9LEPT|nr:hypothetical protein [Leptospira paudalimensis]MCW7502889.1 hypothetical protein [Leptospira paudalimensis]
MDTNRQGAVARFDDQYDNQNHYLWRLFLHHNTPCSIETDKNQDQIVILMNIGYSVGNLPVKMFFANTKSESLEEMPTKDIQCFMFWGY